MNQIGKYQIPKSLILILTTRLPEAIKVEQEWDWVQNWTTNQLNIYYFTLNGDHIYCIEKCIDL